MKKHIFFCESSPNLGGQEFQLLQQAKVLKDLGFKCILFCKPHSKIRIEAISRNIDVEVINFCNAIDLKSIFKLCNFIFKLRPLALIVHSGHDATVGGLAVFFSNLFKSKVSVIRMKTYDAGVSNGFSYNHLFSATYTPSNFLRLKLLSYKKISPNKISVLYPGVDFKNLNNQSFLPSHLLNWINAHPGPILAHGAMLRGEKGHMIILKALPKVLSSFPNVRYVVAGSGPDLKLLKSLVEELSLQEHVFFAGLIQPISSLLKISTMALMPSLREPLGMFQIESQYLEVPTLASNVDGIPETLLHHETGLLVEPGNIEAWVQSIIWALNNLDTMKKWAKNGSVFVQGKFSRDANTNALIKILGLNF